LVAFISLMAFIGCASGSWASGRAEKVPVEEVITTVPPQKQPILLKVYVVESATSARIYTEGMYVPQGAAAYFPTRFELSGKEHQLMFTTDLAYRIMARKELGSGVLVYSVEASIPARKDAAGRRYTVSFPLGALGPEGGKSIQPASYALQQGIKKAGLAKGLVRLESLAFDEMTAKFKAVVVVGAK